MNGVSNPFRSACSRSSNPRSNKVREKPPLVSAPSIKADNCRNVAGTPSNKVGENVCTSHVGCTCVWRHIVCG